LQIKVEKEIGDRQGEASVKPGRKPQEGWSLEQAIEWVVDEWVVEL
jgi:hypothetical protein